MSGNQPMTYENNYKVYSFDIYYYYYCYNKYYSITNNPQTALWFPLPVMRSTQWIQLHTI